jgi:hypothetical protein
MLLRLSLLSVLLCTLSGGGHHALALCFCLLLLCHLQHSTSQHEAYRLVRKDEVAA